MNHIERWKMHSRQRADERYEIILTEETHNEIVSLIQRGRYEFRERQGKRRILYVIIFRGEFVKLVFNTRWRKIITFLKLQEPPLAISPSLIYERRPRM